LLAEWRDLQGNWLVYLHLQIFLGASAEGVTNGELNAAFLLRLYFPYVASARYCASHQTQPRIRRWHLTIISALPFSLAMIVCLSGRE
jgi:hypothetical protein